MVSGRCVPAISSASEPPSPRGPWLFQGSLRLAHRLLRPPLPVSVPPLDFPLRLYERALPYGTLLAGTETFPLSPLFCLTMPSSFDPGDADRCTYPVLPCRYQPSPVTKRLGHPKTHDSL